MSEPALQYAYTCHTNLAWKRDVNGSKGEIYTVKWAFQFLGPVQYAYECTCPAFKYRHKRGAEFCKHILAVKHERCAWNEMCDPSIKPVEQSVVEGLFKLLCPKCKGIVTPVEVMV